MNCHNHPQKSALSVCHACGNHFCSECLVEGGDYYYCKSEPCQAAISKVPEERSAASPEMQQRMDAFIRGFWRFFWVRLILGLLVSAFAFPISLGAAIIVGLVEAAIVGGIAAWMLDNLKRWSSFWRGLFLVGATLRLLVDAVVFLGLLLEASGDYSSGGGAGPQEFALVALIDLAWVIYVFRFLLNADVKAEFHKANLAY